MATQVGPSCSSVAEDRENTSCWFLLSEGLLFLCNRRHALVREDSCTRINISNRASDEPAKLSFEFLEEITNSFAPDRKLGSGAFGDVYKGVLKDGEVIAVKKLRIMANIDGTQFKNEFRHLKRLRHENIVRLVGFCDETKKVLAQYEGKTILADSIERALCLEFVPNGSLGNFISEEHLGLNWHMRFKIIKGICEGLKYLHDIHIYHFDLKPDNILLDEKMVPKITDFGLSRLIGTANTIMTMTPLGTFGYCPPEFMAKQILTDKHDIFSLGVIIQKMVTGIMDNLSIGEMNEQECIEHVHNKWRERLEEMPGYTALDAHCEQVKTCIEVAVDCKQADRRKRPLIKDIVDKLNKVETKKDDPPSQIDQQDVAITTKTSSSSSTVLKRSHSSGDRIEIKAMTRSVLEHIIDGRMEPCNLPFELLQEITENFSHDRIISQGGHAVVYKGVLQNGSVAVKKLSGTATIEEREFYRAADFLMTIKDQNIVPFLGYCGHTEIKALQLDEPRGYIYGEIREMLLCFKYMGKGGLDQHPTDELRGLDWNTRYQIIKGTCYGVEYLHKGYVAPEYLDCHVVSFKSDIYSLGVIIIELVTGRRDVPDIINVLRRWRHRWNKLGKHPPLGHQQITKCIEIAVSCMSENRKRRPFIWDIVSMLNELETTDEHTSRVDEPIVGQVSTYPWEMLDVDPLELCFPSEPNKRTPCSLELTNESDDHIAFSICTTSSLQYCMEPNKGVVPPRSKCNVTVTLQAQNSAPQCVMRKDKLTVRMTSVNEGSVEEDITDDMFVGEKGKVVDEVDLEVVFLS